MKYTMIVDGKETTIELPDNYLMNMNKKYGMSNRDAALAYIENEGNVEKVIDGKQVKESPKKARKTKIDPVKQSFISIVADFIEEQDNISNVEKTNPQRVIEFEIAGEKYSLTLAKKRNQ